MTICTDFSVRRNTTMPLTFTVLDAKGRPHPTLKHLDSAILIIRLMSGDTITVPLSVKHGGVGTVLTAEQTRSWTWRWARYEVAVEVKGIRSVIYEGNLTLDNDLGA